MFEEIILSEKISTLLKADKFQILVAWHLLPSLLTCCRLLRFLSFTRFLASFSLKFLLNFNPSSTVFLIPGGSLASFLLL